MTGYSNELDLVTEKEELDYSPMSNGSKKN